VPQSGDGESAAYFAEYGVPDPSHTTALPSPMTHVADRGIAVAVTPGTVAVCDTGFHIARSRHIHVGTRTNCACLSSGFIRITGSGSTDSRTTCCATTAGSGFGIGPLPSFGFGFAPSKRGRIPMPLPRS
jgi:hypothetical protein